jgi:diketogulonate reductase-like aldo/keto reductase
MAPIAKNHNCSAARISLAWLLAKPVVTSVIIGARNVKQLQDNLASVDVNLNENEIRLLDEVSTLPPEYPGWMIPFQAMDRLTPQANRLEELKKQLATTST